eukprot:s737_g32.t1
MRFLLLVATLVKSSADKALVLGDSWAEYSLETLQEKCDTITSMVNRGIAGTTAAEWAANDNCATKPTDSLCCRSTGSCSLYDVSFNDTFRTAWVSIGGNDFFLTGCSSDPAMLSTIQANIQKVVADLQNLSPQTTIVLTGYSVPSRPLTWHPSPSCSEFSALLPLNSAVKAAAEAQNVEYVDVSQVMGGNATQWSDVQFYADSIHLNAAGYRLLWDHPPLQAAMQCLLGQSVSGAEPRKGAASLASLAVILPWMR